MLSKSQISAVTALHHKKYRREENLFIAEGEKVVKELLDSKWGVTTIYGTQNFFQRLSKSVRIPKRTEVILVTEVEMQKISALTTPQHVLAIAEMPEQKEIDYKGGLKLMLDNINDPGNFGTLIRIADWFGIEEIICSPETVDCFNPKVVQAAMGSLFRSSVSYIDLTEVLSRNISEMKLPVFGTVLDGKSIYEQDLPENAFILIGNESAGISAGVLPFVTNAVTIPSFEGSKTDSLNVAVATGIVCAEFRRK